MTPIIHQTDFFRPHEDPDDHWDLAFTYGLESLGLVKLEAIVVDYPPPHQSGNPDAVSIAQLNYLTRRAVPFGTGHATPYKDLSAGSEPSGAVRLILDVLERSDEPVRVLIAGSARDVAQAVRVDPNLFARKCGGIYLNAGTGETPGRPEMELEYNVRLDREAYRALFDAPCPLYWAPCFERLGVEWTVSEYGSWWKFLQSEILDTLDRGLKNYFLCMFEKSESTSWLTRLHDAVDEAVYAKFAAEYRNMWCPVSFLNAAGRTVTADGRIIATEGNSESVFGFTPIRVACDDHYLTRWNHDAASTDRFILQVRDRTAYSKAMATALGEVIRQVGQAKR